MKDFLSEYLITLNGKRNTKIHDILADVRVSKNDLDSIADKMRDSKRNAPIVISKEKFGSLIRQDSFDAAHRDAGRRILDLFQVSNRISLVLDSHTSILSSEIRAIEDEISAMEKAIANYGFTLSDNGFYDYAFTETFNDDTFRETDGNIVLTDRSGQNFASDEQALVNAASGILSLSPELKISYPLSGNILNSNCLALATSNTDVSNALNAKASNGWRMAISSPKPFTSKIDDTFTQQGAQVELEIFLAVSSPCDTVVLVPFSDTPVDIMRVSVFSDNNDQSTSKVVLDSKTSLDRPLSIHFPLQSISKIRIAINQSVYSRGESPSAQVESVYRDFYTDIKTQREDVVKYVGKTYNENKKALKRTFLNAQNKDKNLRIFKSEIPEINFEPSYGPLTIDKIVKGYNPNNPGQDMWSYKSKSTQFMRRMIDEKVFSNNTDILNDRYIFNSNRSFLSSNKPLHMTMMSGSAMYTDSSLSSQAPLSADIISYSTIQEQQYLSYQYNLGLRNIQIGSGERIYRGVFISKQIPAPSDSGEVKIKVDEINFELLGTSRDSKIITSIEYSICNKSNPTKETDWVATLPIDNPSVVAERLFVDGLGMGQLRFPASMSGNFAIYKNGYKLDLTGVTRFNISDQSAISSVQIPMTMFTSSDVFTVDYQPYGDQSIINFKNRGIEESLLGTAFDDSGAGETFSGSFDDQIITLKNEPYVNETLVQNGSSYTSAGFVSAYQPITILMSDGTVAINHTNYKGTIQNSLATFDETNTVYIQSGKNIVFNKPITQNFTVYYQYLPSNLRFRIIMRVNDINYVSPSVNSIQLKTKTRKANVRKLI